MACSNFSKKFKKLFSNVMANQDCTIGLAYRFTPYGPWTEASFNLSTGGFEFEEGFYFDEGFDLNEFSIIEDYVMKKFKVRLIGTNFQAVCFQKNDQSLSCLLSMKATDLRKENAS